MKDAMCGIFVSGNVLTLSERLFACVAGKGLLGDVAIGKLLSTSLLSLLCAPKGFQIRPRRRPCCDLN